MSDLPIPEVDQMRAMLDGTIHALLRHYGVDPERTDFRKLITVDRQKLTDFLKDNPAIAERYFQKHSSADAIHDVERLSHDGVEYITAWMDHGQARSSKRFGSLSEAVAEHVLVSHGMY